MTWIFNANNIKNEISINTVKFVVIFVIKIAKTFWIQGGFSSIKG